MIRRLFSSLRRAGRCKCALRFLAQGVYDIDCPVHGIDQSRRHG